MENVMPYLKYSLWMQGLSLDKAPNEVIQGRYEHWGTFFKDSASPDKKIYGSGINIKPYNVYVRDYPITPSSHPPVIISLRYEFVEMLHLHTYHPMEHKKMWLQWDEEFFRNLLAHMRF